MIAVIADDITGAAEIAGVGLRHGMTVALTTTSDFACPSVQLWVLALNTRSMVSQKAETTISDNVRRLVTAGIKDIFKKTDSVLRGHVIKELQAQLESQGMRKAILCPANPIGGRQIIDGIYMIDGIPVNETSFALDPEFPVTSSVVAEMLGEDFQEETGISVINAASENDLSEAIKRKDKYTILAGSSAFFNAYLSFKKFPCIPFRDDIPKFENAFYVFGSTFEKSRQVLNSASKSGIKVTYIDPLLIEKPEMKLNIESCSVSLIDSFISDGRAILAIGNPVLGGREAAEKLRQYVAVVVKKVFAKVSVKELVIEGGATSSAIVEALDFRHFIPTQELANGVVRMKVVESDNLHLTIKPGSYKFPETVWNFSKQNK